MNVNNNNAGTHMSPCTLLCTIFFQQTLTSLIYYHDALYKEEELYMDIENKTTVIEDTATVSRFDDVKIELNSNIDMRLDYLVIAC